MVNGAGEALWSGLGKTMCRGAIGGVLTCVRAEPYEITIM